VSANSLYWMATTSLIVIFIVALLEDWFKLGEWH
jgi:hypothetical protein